MRSISHKRQISRPKIRLLFAISAYILLISSSIIGKFIGLVHADWQILLYLLGGIIITNSVFLALIVSGVNERVKDPTMTGAQVIIAVIWCLIFMAIMPEVRGLLIIAYLSALIFSIFDLSGRALGKISLAFSIAFIGMVVSENYLFNINNDLPVQFLYALIIISTSIWMTSFGSYVARLRTSLSRRNRSLQSAMTRIQKLVNSDELTGIHNRRFLMRVLHEEIVKSQNREKPFCLCLLDLDRFKRVNDKYGHSVGDTLLKEFASVVLQTLRTGDMLRNTDKLCFGRYGGEEFIVILPETGVHGAAVCMERLRKHVAGIKLSGISDLSITVSTGIAQFRKGETLEELMHRADTALYRAKKGGRDRIVVAPDRISDAEKILKESTVEENRHSMLGA
ncbi:MAG: GGDEF domain-containing protein [Gammaproteobacteria bacterium]|nr:GGDEF domain-containing protein [Gammaproteobacteria bacterium]